MDYNRIIVSERFREILDKFRSNNIYAEYLYNGMIPKEISKEGFPQFVSDSNESGRISYVDYKKMHVLVRDIFDYNQEQTEYYVNSLYDINYGISGSDIHYLFENLKPRVKTRIGSFLNKIFINIDEKYVEHFVNSYKIFSKETSDNFKVVEGEELRKYYYGEYHHNGRGTLGSSCMRHSRCQNYFKMYMFNRDKVKMLLLFSKDGMVKARALLWHLNEDNGLDSEFKFMDRVYYTNEDQVPLFRKWASENGYITKEKMSWGTPNRFVDSEGNPFEKNMEITLNKWKYTKEFHNSGGMPYLDTFKWLNIKTGIFYNYKPKVSSVEESRNIFTLVSTNGRLYSYDYLMLDEINNEYLFDTEVVYLEYLNKMVSRNLLIRSKVNDAYLLLEHSEHVKILNDYIFKEKYEKFNDRSSINSAIKKKKEEIAELERRKRQIISKNMVSLKSYVEDNKDLLENDFDLSSIEEIEDSKKASKKKYPSYQEYLNSPFESGGGRTKIYDDVEKEKIIKKYKSLVKKVRR